MSNQCISVFLILCALPFSLAQPSTGHLEHRDFDARVSANATFLARPSQAQVDELDHLSQKLPHLQIRFDQTSGVTRTLYRLGGYLTETPSSQEALAVGMDFVAAYRVALGLEEADLAEFEEQDRVFSKVTGATHIYLRQKHLGLPVYNGILHVNVNRDGKLLSINNAFVPSIAASVGTIEPEITAAQAVLATASHLGQLLVSLPEIKTEGEGKEVHIEAPGYSKASIAAQKMWLPFRAGDTRLVWNFQIHTIDGQHVYDFTVDAVSGEVLSRFDWVDAADYKVYPHALESPNHTSPLPPAEGRVTLVDPQNATASPFGWHDTDGIAGPEFTILRGNNAHAYLDLNNTSTPPANQPDGGAGLSFDFPIDHSMGPETDEDAALTNLFYWSNIIHDITYQYGFDEQGGNFQVNNYGRGGVGGDDVRSEAQDGRDVGNTNNAFFFTPPDGSRPRMEMYVFTSTNPRRDGDLDNGIICHEYGHGISNRLVGGPSNVNCLANVQQPGEGISDWFTLVLTHQEGALGTDPRGMGTYVLGQPLDGPGIRPQRYSTDPAINNYTYASVGGFGSSHSRGSVWAQANWEVYWALIDEHGFSADVYDPMGGFGNQRMLLYTIEGFKNTICSPAFTDVRDGIIQAAIDNYGGEDECLLWQAYAAFGMGVDAVSGGPNGTMPVDGFAVPASCSCAPPPAPTNLAAVLNPSDEVVLTWNGSGGTYDVFRSEGQCPGSNFQTIAAALNTATFTDTTAMPGTTYAYAVRENNGACASANSGCVTIFTCDSLTNLLPRWGSNVNVLHMIPCL